MKFSESFNRQLKVVVDEMLEEVWSSVLSGCTIPRMCFDGETFFFPPAYINFQSNDGFIRIEKPKVIQTEDDLEQFEPNDLERVVIQTITDTPQKRRKKVKAAMVEELRRIAILIEKGE